MDATAGIADAYRLAGQKDKGRHQYEAVSALYYLGYVCIGFRVALPDAGYKKPHPN